VKVRGRVPAELMVKFEAATAQQCLVVDRWWRDGDAAPAKLMV